MTLPKLPEAINK